MRIRQMALCGTLAASLVAQGSEQGFRWVGLRTGSVAFDPQENAKVGTFFGGQIGMLFDQQRYGLSIEGFITHPKNDFHPGLKLNHAEASVTLLSGLSDDAASRLWPYFGVGLGALSYPHGTSATTAVESIKVAVAHVSLGLLHRPVRGLMWGVEGRYLLSFTKKDLKEVQGSVLFGFTWGSSMARPEAVASRPPLEVKAPPPTPPAAVKPVPVEPVAPPPVKAVPPPPVPPPAAKPVPVAPVPTPVVKAAPPLPVPSPVVKAPLPMPALAGAADTTSPLPRVAPAPTALKPAAPGSERTQRLAALRQGDLPKALELGRQRIKAIAAHRWSIRLEVADLASTLKTAANAFPAGEADLFIAPIKLKGGRTSYQLFLGEYASKAEAERAAATVPALFRQGGQRPKPFLVETIPAQSSR